MTNSCRCWCGRQAVHCEQGGLGTGIGDRGIRRPEIAIAIYYVGMDVMQAIPPDEDFRPEEGRIADSETSFGQDCLRISQLGRHGDSPNESVYVIQHNGCCAAVPPRTRAIGGTFEFTFVLPKPANAGNTRPHKRKATKLAPKTRADVAKSKPATKATRTTLTDEEKREFRRVRASEDRQRRKELGLCKDCPTKAIEGQSRCADCAEQHGQSRQRQRQAPHC